MSNTMYRQGDVIIRRLNNTVPDHATPVELENGRVILAHGEVTGHAHAVVGNDVELLEVPAEVTEKMIDDVERYLRVGNKGADVVHEEHATISLPPGNYAIVRQREYSPERPRYVAD